MTVKTKRKLRDVNFEGKDSHIALVSKQQGGPANGQDYSLVIKAVNFSEEAIQKMQKIKVTLSVPDFLSKFYHIYGSDAEVLARLMGYDPEKDDSKIDYDYDNDWYENWIESRLESIEVIKSLNDADNPDTILASLDEDQYLAFLKDQQTLEKAFKKYDREQKDSTKATKVVKADTSTTNVETDEVEATASVTKTVEKNPMPNHVKIVEQEVTVEMVEKAALDSVNNQLREALEQITKANEQLAVFKAEKAEAVRKARLAKVEAAVKDTAKAAVIFKALSLVETDEVFDEVVTAISTMTVAVEKSALFEEQGAGSVETEAAPVKSGVAKILMQQYPTK